MIRLAEWWSSGTLIEVEGHQIFTRVNGVGPTVVFLHGFPTSSHDWSDVIADLESEFRCVTFDYLGYGASDKPIDGDYSSMLQTQRALKVLSLLGVERATVVGHDLGGILLQQLIYASVHGRTTLEIERAIFTNSSVFAELYQPTPGQLALVDPVNGPQIAQHITMATLEASMTTLFPTHPPTPDRINDIWAAISEKNGQLLWPQQLVYMAERAAAGPSWVDAMRRASTPFGFIYGLADAISGAQILLEAKLVLPDARCIGLPGLGHYPQVESAPQFIAALSSVLQQSARERR